MINKASKNFYLIQQKYIKIYNNNPKVLEQETFWDYLEMDINKLLKLHPADHQYEQLAEYILNYFELLRNLTYNV